MIMNKILIITLFILWILTGCKNKQDAYSIESTANNVSINNTAKLEDLTIDSILLVGRNPDVLYIVAIGRYEFIDGCTRNIDSRFKLINRSEDINNIMEDLKSLEMLSLPNEDQISSYDFLYKPIIKEDRLWFFDNDPLDVMILLVLYSNCGKCIPVWMDLSYVNVQNQFFHSSKDLMIKLYDILGYSYGAKSIDD